MNITLQGGSKRNHTEHRQVCNRKWQEALSQAYELFGISPEDTVAVQKQAILDSMGSDRRNSILDSLLHIIDVIFFRDHVDQEGLEHLLRRKHLLPKYHLTNTECILEDDGITTKVCKGTTGATMLTDRDNNKIYMNLNCLVNSWPCDNRDYKRYLDGYVCRSPLNFFIHTFAHELIHAWINALGEHANLFRVDRVYGDENEGHGEGFLTCNYIVLGGQGSRWQLYKTESKNRVLDTLRERKARGGHVSFVEELQGAVGSEADIPEPPIQLPLHRSNIDKSTFLVDGEEQNGTVADEEKGAILNMHKHRYILRYTLVNGILKSATLSAPANCSSSQL